ncbi:uncharacterized aarF domain-containing protein kinase 2-like isoform X1 [Penaeus chinensis]|uniref:uncharacterized aarF domain-containing protein kinase 2-like isoform X1 n=1 Tax=Penaeus chinensis TaxID=139456 RepID=UPI001FB743A6|nr:uncharacterized aarF domain-containing protein kinase 2-like isoform X1 [Penaeus chinensis]XP_047496412.1 uncharacterized aarF domain-containing protein kinase 2-like isoform X1 [Penaeus chinensis]XP_047496421.1 uncharacterized aarF domain-containing protein kinase 2-like isoform X1 [Penaeus chinensis]
MFQAVQKHLVLLIPTANIPSNAISKANLICNQSISKTSNSLTTLKMCLNHTQHYHSKSFLLPPSLIKSGMPYTNNNVHVLRVYNQLVSSCRQQGRDKIVKIRSAFTRNMNKGSLRPRRETLGKLVLMSSFLAPTMSFNNAQVEKKIPVIEITRKAKKNRSYLIQLFLEIYEAFRLCLRALRLVITFTPIFALYPMTFFGEECKDLWWYLLLRGIEFSGPILIKLGQWASTRRDLFPDACCRQFAKLQRSVKPHSWKYTKYMMRKAFGPDWRKIFVKFDNNRNPVGSGCVAQVYKVWMSAEAISDEEILTEILSEMEDDVSDSFEGMHVIGFRSLFGIDDGEDVKQKRILEEWREKRDQMRREKEAQRRAGIDKEEQNVDLHEVVLEKEKKEMSKVDPENGEKHVKDHETGMIKGNKEFVVEASVDESGKELVEINTGIIKEDKQMLDICASAVVSRKEQSNIVSDREFEKTAEKMKEIASDNQLVEKFYKEESKDTTSSFQSENDDSGKSDVDVLTVTENLVAELVNTEEDQQRQADLEPDEEPIEDITEHSLVEEWQEGVHDKSLPLEEGPPEDLDGLVPVAVKVLHPGIYSNFRRDLKIMKACASFISAIYPPLKWLSLPQCVQEFAEVMSCQIDLKLEAENMELFAENFADNPYVRFPRILRPYVTRKVLVETYEEGEQMIDFIGTTGEDKPAELKKRLAEIGVDALLKMVFVDNLVHGDLHPGNILVQNNSAKEEGSNVASGDVVKFMMVDVGCDTFVMHVEPDPNPLRICLLDCGVASRLKEKDLANFKAVFRQVVFGDGESVADLFLNNSEHCCKDPEAFKAEMTSLVNSAREDTIALSQIDVGVLLQQVLKILLHHQVRLESAFSAVVLAVFVLEGLGRTLDPNMDILERARPILVTGKVK